MAPRKGKKSAATPVAKETEAAPAAAAFCAGQVVTNAEALQQMAKSKIAAIGGLPTQSRQVLTSFDPYESTTVNVGSEPAAGNIKFQKIRYTNKSFFLPHMQSFFSTIKTRELFFYSIFIRLFSYSQIRPKLSPQSGHHSNQLPRPQRNQ